MIVTHIAIDLKGQIAMPILALQTDEGLHLSLKGYRLYQMYNTLNIHTR